MRRWFCLGLCMMLIITPVSFLWAQNNDEVIPKLDALNSAQQGDLASLIELAENSEKRGDWAKALGYYNDAFKIFPHPQLNYNIAICHERLGAAAEARINYERFVRLMPKAPEVADVQAKLRVLKAQAVRNETSLRISSTPSGAVVYLNDEANGAIGTTPTIDLPVAPGKYTVILKLEGYASQRKEVVVESGRQTQEAITLKALPRVQDTKQGDVRRRGAGHVAPIALLAIGGVSLVGTWYFASVVGDPDDDLEDEDIAFAETMMWTTGGVALLCVAGSIVLFTQEGGHALSKKKRSWLDVQKRGITNVGAWFHGASGGVGIRGRF